MFMNQSTAQLVISHSMDYLKKNSLLITILQRLSQPVCVKFLLWSQLSNSCSNYLVLREWTFIDSFKPCEWTNYKTLMKNSSLKFILTVRWSYFIHLVWYLCLLYAMKEKSLLTFCLLHFGLWTYPYKMFTCDL